MKVFKKIKDWLITPKPLSAELEIVERCGQPPLYIVWDPKGFRNETFDTFAEAKRHADSFKWKLV